MKFLAFLDDLVGKVLKYITCGCLLLLLIQLIVGIVVRYFRLGSIAKFDEFITLFFCWIIFFGAALITRDWSHLSVDFLDILLSKRKEYSRYLKIIIYSFSLVFVLFFIKSGIVLFTVSGTMTSEMLQLPKRLWYLPIPLSGLLMAIYVCYNLIWVILNPQKEKEVT